jgi:hypothetical protein
MNHRYDHKLRSLDAKVDSVRKTPHRCPSDVAVNDGIFQGMLGEQWKSSQGLVEEITSEI